MYPQTSEKLITRLKHLFGETVCTMSLIDSQVAFNGDLAFLLEEWRVKMRKTIVIMISLLFFIGIASQSSARKIHWIVKLRSHVMLFRRQGKRQALPLEMTAICKWE
jgi:hypothetical protein